jgi:hypothetical protein
LSVGSVLLGISLIVMVASVPEGPGRGLALLFSIAQGGGLIMAGVVLAWMAAVLQELRGIRKALIPRNIDTNPAP